MRYLALLGALVLAPILATGPALAQTQTTVNVTVTGNSFTASPGAVVGGSMTESATWSGTAAGSPISGSIQVQESRSYAAETPSGSMQGQFTLIDGVGNAIWGTLSGQFSADATGSTAQGTYVISGGAGTYAGASGSGSFSQAISLGAAPSLTLSGTMASSMYQYVPTNPYLYAPPAVYQYPGIAYQDSATVYQYQAPSAYVPSVADVSSPYTPGAVHPQGRYAYQGEPGATVYNVGTGVVVVPNQLVPRPDAPSSITGRESQQGCYGVSGEGQAYSITGQPCAR